MRTSTVLVADDHDDSRTVYALYLRHCGHRVLEARDGREALEMARLHAPDALVLDFRMPHLDAAGVLRALREAGSGAPPALVLTADTRAETRREAEAAGCDAFELKPCDPRDLVARLAQVMDGARREPVRVAGPPERASSAPATLHLPGIRVIGNAA